VRKWKPPTEVWWDPSKEEDPFETVEGLEAKQQELKELLDLTDEHLEVTRDQITATSVVDGMT
jgi:hypothetical protein